MTDLQELVFDVVSSSGFRLCVSICALFLTHHHFDELMISESWASTITGGIGVLVNTAIGGGTLIEVLRDELDALLEDDDE